MIPNLTPSERDHWNKSMAHYARRNRPRKFTMRTVLIIAFLLAFWICLIGTCHALAWKPVKVPVWDSVLIDHSEIPQIDSL